MRKTRSFWMRILVLILILSIMPFSALADGYVIENISAESYVDEFGQMVESFTVRFAEGTDLTGITKANVDQIRATSKVPQVMRLVGTGDDTGKLLGLDKDWSYRIIKQVGNYGESWTANFGPNTKLNLPRGLNNLWTKGGVMYVPPIR